MPVYKYIGKHNLTIRNYLGLKRREWWSKTQQLFISRHKYEVPACFIVGCGHSGTTMLAAKLSRHKRTYVVNHETYCFLPYNSVNYIRRNLRETINEAIENEAQVFIEKTPKHIHCKKLIEKFIESPKFICLYRNPLDSISSLTKRFSLNHSIERWNIDNKAVFDYREDNCLQVSYEQLTSEPDEVFKKICNFLSLNFDVEIIGEGKTVYDSKTINKGNFEMRKRQVRGVIKPRINTWEERLTYKEAKIVVDKTKFLYEKLGYKYDSNLNLVNWERS